MLRPARRELTRLLKSARSLTAFKKLSTTSDCANAGSAEKFLKDYCGITNQNNGTYNSNYGYYLYDGKTYQNIIPQNGDVAYPAGTTFDANGLTINITDTSVAQERLVTEGAYSWWLGDAVNLVEDNYNVDLNGKTLDFGFKNVGSGSDAYGAITYSSPERMYVNMDAELATSLKAGDNGNELKIYDPYGIAALLAHEMNHVVQHNFNFPSYYEDESIPLYITEGMGGLTAGRYYRFFSGQFGYS